MSPQRRKAKQRSKTNAKNCNSESLLEINKIEENSLQKKEKISKITKYCNNLSLQELDFLIKIIKSMHI